jgi:putative flavoprotein involved in K+ transport
MSPTADFTDRTATQSAGPYDVLVIGAGQAGLATAAQLKQRGLDVLVLDAGLEVGDSWRRRWDSLTLFTTRRHSALPGLPFPGDPSGWPTKDEVADYLYAYAKHFAVAVRLATQVTRIRRDGAELVVEAGAEAFRARHVVVATGPFQRPAIPAAAATFGPTVRQLHSSDYRNPDDLPHGPVLVVGGGNSGVQIAAEVARRRQVHLAVATRNKHVPARLLGRDMFSWLVGLGLITAPTQSRRARRLRRGGGDLVIGTGRRLLRSLGVTTHPAFTDADGSTARFADGSTADVASVIWATGFRLDHSFVDPELTRDGEPDPRLHFVGLPWQRSRGSALLGFVGADATELAGVIAKDVHAGPGAIPVGRAAE